MTYLADSRISVLRARIEMLVGPRPHSMHPRPMLVEAWHSAGGNVGQWIENVRGDHDWIDAGSLMPLPLRATFAGAIVDYLISRAAPDPWQAEQTRLAATGEVRMTELEEPPSLDDPNGIWLTYSWWQQPALVVLADPYRDDLNLVCCAVFSWRHADDHAPPARFSEHPVAGDGRAPHDQVVAARALRRSSSERGDDGHRPRAACDDRPPSRVDG